MNGLSLSDYPKFEQDFKLVTVRYRKDSGELRWTYANTAAWLALVEDKPYPDGAVFAKRATMTEPDPYFASSAVPSGRVRYQLMVHNSKKYAETGGWGFAIFNADGSPSYDGKTGRDIGVTCYSCHTRAAKIGYVFSRPMTDKAASHQQPTIAEFEPVDVSTLPPALRRLLPSVDSVLSLKGPEREHSFGGTLNELIPTLAAHAKRMGQPCAFLAKNGSWSAAWTDPNGGACSEGGRDGTWTIAYQNGSRTRFCQTEAR